MSKRFADLRGRALSGVAMAGAGLLAVWAGGAVFATLVCAVAGAMVWELTRMLDPQAPQGKATASGLSAAVALAVFTWRLTGLVRLGALALAAALLVWRFPAGRWVAGGYMAAILFAGLGLIALRGAYGAPWVLWLVLVVIASDVAGYFAGRVLGGPLMWRRVSPKKTWSGTAAGWLAAAGVGLACAPALGALPAGLVVASLLVAVAGQLGDIAESAIKRRAGVKDSSALIPGHGGVMDRFDAMVAAALGVLVLAESGFLARIAAG